MREPSLLHLAIFGSSLPFLFDPRLDQTASDSFWKYTKRHVFVETAEEPSYASLEASTILTLDLSGMTNGPQVAGRLAVITKLAFNLRAVDDLVLRPSAQTDEQNSQISNPGFKQHARLFWAIYALDSFISITTRQPPGLDEHTLRYFLPTRDKAWESDRSGQHHDSWPRPDNLPMSPELTFLHLLKLLDVSRDVHRVYLEYLILPEDDDARALCWLTMFTEHVKAIDMWLQRWSSSVIVGIRSPSASPAAVMQHAYGQALLIYSNGLVEFCDQPSLALHILEIQEDAQRRCAECVETITNIASSFVDLMGDQLGWPFAWSMWIAARYLLVAAFHRSTALQPQFHTLLNYTHEMGLYWQISKKYWWLLRRAEHALRMRNAAVDQDVPRILTSIVNLRVPTSDLEDQFRVDPVLARLKGPQDIPPRSIDAASTGEFGPAEMEAVNLDVYDRSVFGPGGHLSETWFSMPLFASSAHQQFPGDDGSGGTGREMGWEFSS
ncbi:uncharacterized protein DNG_08046 [Cephalotrichum gorgonifer]|uniref:Xylanolytic transcriptional activator regulatory domain-containing protein n=1 Tax=Cephalotrichum gorgonifer TaxID=2041049 RepID=A0AAE8N4E8_9PEZI|nr:uncharacterized protein DNG_08046 [Cephalotrichum gorgonifer]